MEERRYYSNAKMRPSNRSSCRITGQPPLLGRVVERAGREAGPNPAVGQNLAPDHKGGISARGIVRAAPGIFSRRPRTPAPVPLPASAGRRVELPNAAIRPPTESSK